MLIVTPDNTEIYNDFFPNLNCVKYVFSPRSLTRDYTDPYIKDQDYILFAGNFGEGDFIGEFGHAYYENHRTYEFQAKQIFDTALSIGIPMIGINWGMSLFCIKCGLDFRHAEDKENHLVTYKSNVYAVNSPHAFSVLPSRTSRFKYDAINGNYVECFYAPTYKLFSVRWNPVENCPQSGVDLFDKLLKEYVKVTR